MCLAVHGENEVFKMEHILKLFKGELLNFVVLIDFPKVPLFTLALMTSTLKTRTTQLGD